MGKVYSEVKMVNNVRWQCCCQKKYDIRGRGRGMKDTEWRIPQVSGQFSEEIEAYFSALFPDMESFVFHELISDLVHIDVNIMKPSPNSRLLCNVHKRYERHADDSS